MCRYFFYFKPIENKNYCVIYAFFHFEKQSFLISISSFDVSLMKEYMGDNSIVFKLLKCNRFILGMKGWKFLIPWLINTTGGSDPQAETFIFIKSFIFLKKHDLFHK